MDNNLVLQPIDQEDSPTDEDIGGGVSAVSPIEEQPVSQSIVHKDTKKPTDKLKKKDIKVSQKENDGEIQSFVSRDHLPLTTMKKRFSCCFAYSLLHIEEKN